MAYFEWHEKPGYYADITRHFDPDAEILDVGCGRAWLADHFSNYTGVDSSAEAVEQARSAGRNVVCADVNRGLPFGDHVFDAAILKDVLEHVDRPDAIVREVRRVLKPGGRVFASSPDAQRWVWHDYTHRRPFTRRAYRLLFADAGFEVERVGYESVVPGTGVVSGWTRKKRRPLVFRLIAWLPWTRRHVWLLARLPASNREQPTAASRRCWADGLEEAARASRRFLPRVTADGAEPALPEFVPEALVGHDSADALRPRCLVERKKHRPFAGHLTQRRNVAGED